jgi:hypothetical protein
MYCPWCERFRDATTEWTEELRRLAEIGLAMLKKDLERSGHINPFFVLRHKDGGLEQLNVPEKYADLMNSGSAKTTIFGFVRSWVREFGITAVVIGTDAWFSRSTPQARGLSQEEFDRIVREEGSENAEKRGLVVRKEAAVVNVQTTLRVMSLSQVYERLGRRDIVFREISQIEAPIDNFVGRQKMFGKMDSEDLE